MLKETVLPPIVMSEKITTIVFDLGNVLIKWDPRLLYNKMFTTEEETEHFLETVCTGEWNAMQDCGRTFADAIAEKSAEFPEMKSYIAAYFERWPEMLGGLIEGTVDILERLHRSGNYRLLALTNWSTETFPVALERYDIWKYFEGILVSGEEKLIKPDEKIYRLLAQRYHVKPEEAVFIDDSEKNVIGARAIGMKAIHFNNPADLEEQLKGLGVRL